MYCQHWSRQMTCGPQFGDGTPVPAERGPLSAVPWWVWVGIVALVLMRK